MTIPLDMTLRQFYPPSILTTCLSKAHLKLFFHLLLGLPSVHFPRSLLTKILNAFFLSTYLSYIPNPQLPPRFHYANSER